MDVELSGERPQPRSSAAMETIDQHRGLLHGGDDGSNKSLDDPFVIDLREKVNPNYRTGSNNNPGALIFQLSFEVAFYWEVGLNWRVGRITKVRR